MIAPPPVASNNNNNNGSSNNNNKSDSDSDSSDWDDDDDFATRKISINIKPISQVDKQKISSSVDELRATVGTWKSLANINLVKPNSRRHHKSTLQLDNIDVQKSLQAPINPQAQQQQPQTRQLQPEILNPSAADSPFSGISTRLPVAFAVQECLDSKLVHPASNNQSPNSEQLIGHIRMAVPPCLADSLAAFDQQQDLEFYLESPTTIQKRIQVNENFVERLKNPSREGDDFTLNQQSCESFRINMQAVREFARKRNRMESGSKYFLLPELVRYHTTSYSNSVATNGTIAEDGLGGMVTQKGPVINIQLNPLNVVSHWLCDLNVTKVRIDISLIEHTNLNGISLTSDDIKNLKVSLEVNGEANSYHSKPDANWNPLDSRLTWSFATLTEFIQRSGNEEVNSCLAKFNLSDGPSTPTSVNVQFSSIDRTLTGTRIALVGSNSFKLVRQKYEVKSSVTDVR